MRLTTKSIIPYFLLVLMAFITLHVTGYQINTNLDSSWKYAINYLTSPQPQLGKDAFFTLGPLGFLLYPVAIKGHIYIANFFWLCLRLIFALCYFHAIKKVAKQENKTYYLNFLLLCIVLSLIPNHYLLILLPIVLLFLPNSIYVNLGLASFFGMLAFMIKFGPGITSYSAIFIFSICATLIHRRISYFIAFIGFAIIFYLLFWLIITGSFVGIIKFTLITKQFISGNDLAMSLSPGNLWGWITLGFLFWLLTYFGFEKTTPSLKANSKILFYTLLLPVFAWFKYSYGREDSHTYFLVGFLTIVTLFILSLQTNLKRLVYIFICCLFAIFFFLINQHHIVHSWKTFITFRYRGISRLLAIQTYNKNLKISSKKAFTKHQLPNKIKQLIGKNSVDIYPYAISLVYGNNLNYKPRPIIQTYADFTPYLDHLNANYYEQDKGADFMVITLPMLNGIDGRYLLNTEPQSWIQILRWYKKVELKDNFILAKKRKQPLKESSRIIATSKSTWNKWITVPNTNAQILRAKLHSQMTLSTRLKVTAFKLGNVYIDYKFNNGQSATYRLLTTTAQSGIWIKPFVLSLNEKHIKKFTLPNNTIVLNKNDYLAHLDQFSFVQNSINIFGWVFVKDYNTFKQKVYIVLQNNKYVYAIKANPMNRPDVENAFQNLKGNHIHSGIIRNFNINNVINGKYNLKLLVTIGTHHFLTPALKTIMVEHKANMNRVVAIRFRYPKDDPFKQALCIQWQAINLTPKQNII